MSPDDFLLGLVMPPMLLFPVQASQPIQSDWAMSPHSVSRYPSASNVAAVLFPCPVHLLPTDNLYDVDRRDVMCWRREGEMYEPPDESDDEQAADEDGMIEDVDGDGDEATGGTVSLQQLASG